MRKGTILVSLVCASAASGCVGSVGDPGTIAGDGESNSRGTGGNVVRGPSIPSPDTGLWRLTRTEYTNSLRDLLGDTSQAGNALSPDSTLSSDSNNFYFDKNADLLKTKVPLVDKYDSIANDVVENALRAGSASRKKLLICDPVSGGTACARMIISAFARRAWRRPLASDELDRLAAAVDVATSNGDGVEEGIKLAFRMALVSPNFLYRVEVDPPGVKGLHPVGSYELATRLSYFIWSSTPDDELLDRAEDGTLGKPDVFAAQLGRLLADSRADALVKNFASQWLNTRAVRDLNQVAPDKTVFRSWDEELREPIASETEMFFRTFLKGDRNMADMLDADFTFANDRLARYYGLPAVSGAGMQEVQAPAITNRFGLLSQASMLASTSNPNRTSPVKRGKWVLMRILCSPPGDVPPNVPPLPKDAKAAGLPANATIRQMMEKHRTMPACVGCHAVMDPVGFALEHYDGIGRWRDAYSNNSIDATGKLDGQDFDGAHDLAKVIKDSPAFVRCVSKMVFAYALGRDAVADGDTAAVDQIATDVVQGGGRIADAIAFVASSKAFQLRGGQK